VKKTNKAVAERVSVSNRKHPYEPVRGYSLRYQQPGFDSERARKEAKKDLPQETAARGAGDEAPPWEAHTAAREAISYFEGKEKFSLQEFEEEVLRTPEAVAKFRAHRAQVEAEQGHRFEDSFEISKKDVNKVKKKIASVVKLDTGVEIHLKPSLADQADSLLERGFDEGKGMKFIKVYFNGEVGS